MLDIWTGFVLHDIVKYLAAAGLAFAAFTLGVGHLRPWRRVQRRRPTRRQILREVAASLVTATIFGSASLAAIFLPAEAGWNRLYDGPLADGWAYALASLVLMILAHDTWFYWTHRLMHLAPVMRHVHRLHHRSRTPTPWTAYAMDPAEALLQAAFAPLFVLLVPTHPLVLLLWSLHMIARNVIGHCGVELYPAGWLDRRPFRWLTSATHHDMHHESGRQNYGLYFTWWDRMMGTEHPRYRDRFLAAAGRAAPARPAGQRRSPGRASSLFLAAGLALAVALAPSVAARAAGERQAGTVQAGTVQAGTVLGDWVTEGYAAKVALQPCAADPDLLCGRITWLWTMTGADGEPSDLLGREVLSGFRREAAGHYGAGRAFNPADGRSYEASLRLRSRHELEITGCVLFLCESQIWRRPFCPEAPRD